MADQPEAQIEFQPGDGLLRALHRKWVEADGTVHWFAFRNPDQPPSDHASVGAESHATPTEVLASLADKPFWRGDRHHVGRVTVAVCQSLDQTQTIEHTPQPGYFGHCDIVGEKDMDTSQQLADACEVIFSEGYPR